jgi:hypothetical protein
LSSRGVSASKARTSLGDIDAAAPDADMLIDGYALGQLNQARRFIVVSTQGKGDEAA